MRHHHQFTPEQFELEAISPNVELDSEVASVVANTVFDGNNQGKSQNNQSWSAWTPVVVHTEDGESKAPNSRYRSKQSEWEYHIYTGFETVAEASGDPNQSFAREMLLALDRDERITRLGPKATTAAGVTTLFFGSAGAYGLAEANGPNLAIPSMAVLGVSAVFGSTLVEHNYRRLVTNPHFNGLRMRNMAGKVAKLSLPPLLMVKGNQK